MKDYLEPCPFCGGTEIKEVIGDFGLHYMVCVSCGAVTSFYNDFAENEPEHTRILWNRRVRK